MIRGDRRRLFMGLYIYVAAAAIAVFGITFVFKSNVEKIKADPEQAPKAQTNFFIGAAISETLPIILLVLGLINQETAGSMEDIYFPAILIIMLMAFAVFFIMLQRSVGVPEDSKNIVDTFSFIAIAMANAIPIAALVFLFLSVQ